MKLSILYFLISMNYSVGFLSASKVKTIGETCATIAHGRPIISCDKEEGLRCDPATSTCVCSEATPFWSTADHACLSKKKNGLGCNNDGDCDAASNFVCICQGHNTPSGACTGPFRCGCDTKVRGHRLSKSQKRCGSAGGADCSQDTDCASEECLTLRKRKLCFQESPEKVIYDEDYRVLVSTGTFPKGNHNPKVITGPQVTDGDSNAEPNPIITGGPPPDVHNTDSHGSAPTGGTVGDHHADPSQRNSRVKSEYNGNGPNVHSHAGPGSVQKKLNIVIPGKPVGVGSPTGLGPNVNVNGTNPGTNGGNSGTDVRSSSNSGSNGKPYTSEAGNHGELTPSDSDESLSGSEDSDNGKPDGSMLGGSQLMSGSEPNGDTQGRNPGTNNKTSPDQTGSHDGAHSKTSNVNDHTYGVGSPGRAMSRGRSMSGSVSNRNTSGQNPGTNSKHAATGQHRESDLGRSSETDSSGHHDTTPIGSRGGAVPGGRSMSNSVPEENTSGQNPGTNSKHTGEHGESDLGRSSQTDSSGHHDISPVGSPGGVNFESRSMSGFVPNGNRNEHISGTNSKHTVGHENSGSRLESSSKPGSNGNHGSSPVGGPGQIMLKGRSTSRPEDAGRPGESMIGKGRSMSGLLPTGKANRQNPETDSGNAEQKPGSSSKTFNGNNDNSGSTTGVMPKGRSMSRPEDIGKPDGSMVGKGRAVGQSEDTGSPKEPVLSNNQNAGNSGSSNAGTGLSTNARHGSGGGSHSGSNSGSNTSDGSTSHNTGHRSAQTRLKILAFFFTELFMYLASQVDLTSCFCLWTI